MSIVREVMSLLRRLRSNDRRLCNNVVTNCVANVGSLAEYREFLEHLRIASVIVRIHKEEPMLGLWRGWRVVNLGLGVGTDTKPERIIEIAGGDGDGVGTFRAGNAGARETILQIVRVDSLAGVRPSNLAN